jgi:adenosylhomocysteine nucleosidase
MTRIAIISAMAGELKPLTKGWQHERRNGVHLWHQRRGNTEWVAACAGPGRQAATRAFAEAEKDGPLDRVISAGWAGALSDDFVPGRAYVVSGVIDAQTGERFPASAAAPDRLALVTSPRVENAAGKLRLAATYGAALVEMEAAAIARLGAMRGIPFVCIKGVSDGFREDLPDFNRFISPDGRFHTLRLLFFILPRPWHWPALVRMGENSSKASHAIRELLLENLEESGEFANQHGNSNLTR